MAGRRTAAGGLLAAGLAAASAEMTAGAAAFAGSSLLRAVRRGVPRHAWPSIGATTTTSVVRRLHFTVAAPGSLTATRDVPSFPIYYNDVYEVNLPSGHRFPMDKYRRVRERVQARLTNADGLERSIRVGAGEVRTSFHISPLATLDELTTTHCPSYVNRFLTGNQTEDEIRAVGFPWSRQGVDRALSSTGGTVAAARAVCEEMRARSARGGEDGEKEARRAAGTGKGDGTAPPAWSAHVAGGTHHAFRDRGEGFCVFSDIAVAANVVLRDYPDVVRRVLIVDLDVHQGNGNAVLFDGRDDVLTFSLHCSHNYFSEKRRSDLDIELPAGCTDPTYLGTLSHWLKRIEAENAVTVEGGKRVGSIDLVFYQAGVDVLATDRLGRMDLTARGVRRRDRLVYDFCHRIGSALVVTMGGGYPRGEEWGSTIEAHADVYLGAHQCLSELMLSGGTAEGQRDT